MRLYIGAIVVELERFNMFVKSFYVLTDSSEKAMGFAVAEATKAYPGKPLHPIKFDVMDSDILRKAARELGMVDAPQSAAPASHPGERQGEGATA